MRTPWNAIHVVKDHATKEVRPRFDASRLPKPAALPRRPLRPNIFKPPVGQKQVYLPNFVVALTRPSRHLPANYASFMVPLWFSKLDLKDYLYNLYNIEVLSIRSYVIQSRLTEKGFEGSQRLYRPRATKKMTVEMTKDGNAANAAFQWPEVPEDLSPWGSQRKEDGIWRNTLEKRKLGQKESDDLLMIKQNEKPPEDMDKVRREAVRKRREAREREEEEGSRQEVVQGEESPKGRRKVKLREIG